MRTVAHRVVSPRAQLGAVLEALRTPRETLRSAGETARAMAKVAGALRPVGASSLTGPIGPHRVWRWARVRLSDVKVVRAALGGTVNDVVLTVITNGFRDLLESRREEVPEDRVVRTMVPVSVRRPGEKGSITTGSRRSSRHSRSGSRTLRSAWSTSAPRWTA
jgi:hypothetical protein